MCRTQLNLSVATFPLNSSARMNCTSKEFANFQHIIAWMKRGQNSGVVQCLNTLERWIMRTILVDIWGNLCRPNVSQTIKWDGGHKKHCWNSRPNYVQIWWWYYLCTKGQTWCAAQVFMLCHELIRVCSYLKRESTAGCKTTSLSMQ